MPQPCGLWSGEGHGQGTGRPLEPPWGDHSRQKLPESPLPRLLRLVLDTERLVSLRVLLVCLTAPPPVSGRLVGRRGGPCRTSLEMAGVWLTPGPPCSAFPQPRSFPRDKPPPHPEPSQQLTNVRPHGVGVSQAPTGAQSPWSRAALGVSPPPTLWASIL